MQWLLIILYMASSCVRTENHLAKQLRGWSKIYVYSVCNGREKVASLSVY